MTNEGGNNAGGRYCQWQLTAGQLDVTVNLDDRESFDVQHKDSQEVDGIGEAAYSLAGHLYVYAAGKVVDVYATSASTDAGNLKVESATAERVLPKLAAEVVRPDVRRSPRQPTVYMNGSIRSDSTA